MYTSVPDDYHLDSSPDVRPGSPRSDRIVAQLAEMRGDNHVTRIVSFDDQQVGWEMTGPQECLPPPLRVHDLAATALVFRSEERRVGKECSSGWGGEQRAQSGTCGACWR